MAQFLWTVFYIAIALWILSRVVAYIIQWLLKRYLDVTLRFGKVGLLSFGKVQLSLHRNVSVHVELEKIWLSSSFVNPDVRKPVVICIEDMRIQVGVSNRGEMPANPRRSVQQKQSLTQLISRVLLIGSYGGLRVHNVTVMLLKTIVPDCLIHFSSPEISLDISAAYDRYELCMNVNNFSCKALRSSEESAGNQNCVAELSFTYKMDAKVDKKEPVKIVALKTAVAKPQMMVTEGFIQSLQTMNRQGVGHADPQQDPEHLQPQTGGQEGPQPATHHLQFQQHIQQLGRRQVETTEDHTDSSESESHWPSDAILSKLQLLEKLQEVTCDISDLAVTIVRETKQRSLSVSLKMFHLGFHNQSYWQATDINCSVYLEEFNTNSMQARFAGLKKIVLKGQLLRDSLDTFVMINSGFFHYHHEEVQYWLSVFSNIFHRPQPPPPHTVAPLRWRKSVPSPVLLSWIDGKSFSSVLEVTEMSSTVSSAVCSGLHGQLSHARFNASLKPGGAVMENHDWFNNYNFSFEVDIQNVSGCLTDSRVALDQMSVKNHYWGQVLYLGILFMKVKKINAELKVEGMTDNLHLDWSTALYNALSQLIGAFRKTRPLLQGHQRHQADDDRLDIEQTSLKTPVKKPLIHFLKFDVSSVNLFVTNAIGVSVVLRVDSVTFSLTHTQSSLSVDGTKVQYVLCDKEYLPLSRSSEIHNPVVHVHQVKVKSSPLQKECRVHILQHLIVRWTMEVHMCLVEGLQDAMALQAKFAGIDGESAVPNLPVSPAGSQQSPMSINILVLADISLEMKLSQAHRLSLHTQNLLLTMTLPDILMEIKDLCIRCDGHSIFSIVGFQLETLPTSHLKGERERAKSLQDATNKAWGVSCHSVDIVFPCKYNFAACYEELMNMVKWVKLVHKVKKKPFTVDSPLPPDITIKLRMLSVEMSDDPFEVKMGLNYELLKDEGNESKKRREVMDAKLMELQKKQFIPVNKREELYANLDKKSSEIYIQRSQQLYSAAPIRSQLCTWLMEDLYITTLADTSFHGKENVLKHMQAIDKESPFPKEPVEFASLWCRYVSASIKLWSVSLRDFPQPMVDVQNKHVWGMLIGAEREGTHRAKRTCQVELDKPWKAMSVERNLPAMKFFHDFSCDMSSLTLAYGVCWEPAVALFNLNMDLINRPSVDPSQPLPFWDKMRLLFHGRFTWSINKMSWLYHASFDPYNNTELMDWTWTHLIMDWTNVPTAGVFFTWKSLPSNCFSNHRVSQFVLQGDLDISVRTASKYNESKLLHLPNLTFRVGLEWLCLGDANDHHSIMPCAPDRVPDFSLQEHDSFRAFRSQNLNLELSLKTKPVTDNLQDIPSCPELYASTLRFLEKIRNCMFSVTRPVRRGKLFSVTTPRKLQLTRHYKKIKLSVDFHKFSICHWMSNAKEHGTELVSDSFVLQMCNRLSLVPQEDGLLHRPRAEWSIKYLKCHLGPTSTYLCKTAGASSAPTERSFFLSIAKVSYQRANRRSKPGKNEEEQRNPTHSVSIHEMKGAWNQFNRTVVIGMWDSYTRAKALRRNLSSEALKGFRVEPTLGHGFQKNRSFSLGNAEAAVQGESNGNDSVTPSPMSKLQMGHAHSMLMKLVSESDSKSVAFTEEPSDSNVEQLHGIRACKLTDVLQTNWLIELQNSQVVVKGCETPGYVIVSAARARITSYTHMPIWRHGQLRSKSTWNGDVDCMQYYSTVGPNNSYEGDNIPWLSRENVEDRANTDLSGLPEMIASGQSVGSVVSSAVTGVMPAASDQCSADTVQLQRIIYRCSCKFFYANYGDVDPNSLPEVPLPMTEDSEVISLEEGVDTFTLLHESVYAYSNSLQFSVIMDIVNNLLLYVEPKKKAASDRLQNMRFKLQLYRDEDQKTPILQLQEVVREKVQELRQLEKEYYIAKTRDDEHRMEMLEAEMEDMKNRIGLKNEELGMRISCYNESQLQVKAQMKMEKAQQSQVVRRNEVCFKYAKWRMTERDGHCGIAELELRNFVYTKVNRDDDSWTHQMELNWVKVENLLTDNFYQKVLVPQGNDGENRQMALRITCTERPPVGGIPVKEHFEVNVAPIQIQMTYQLYKAVMEFFFPDNNVDTDDADDEVDVKLKKDKKYIKKDRDKRREKGDDSEKSSLRSATSFSSADDINKMRERAAKNNTFLYIKIPEVIARVSYKGQKEKNIEDVHDFSFVLPTVEYHNCIWTWFDFLIALKNHSKRVLLSQAIKQKLHWKARVLEETPHTDVQEEEDKAKMLLGAKLLAGQEKPTKKGFFGKSGKS